LNRDPFGARFATRVSPAFLCVPVMIWMGTGGALAQNAAWGRIALFGSASQFTRSDLTKETVAQWSAAVTLHSAPVVEGGFEYGVDFRSSRAIQGDISNLASLYDAYVGGRLPGGVVGARVGQMWLDEIGSLGSVGGIYLDLRQQKPTSIGRFRMGLFAGLEPKVQEIGYYDKVRKAGAFLALEGEEARRSVLGYVQVRNDNLLERSVAILTNFIPIGRTFYIYQAGEYDIAPPGGKGESGLSYFVVNARWAPSRVIEIQGLYHYGLSIDARTLTDDQINGRPVDPRASMPDTPRKSATRTRPRSGESRPDSMRRISSGPASISASPRAGTSVRREKAMTTRSTSPSAGRSARTST
jgi:hypothetical protein